MGLCDMIDTSNKETEVTTMDYIVLDMEWNQPWPGSPSARKVLPVQIRGEIIQIVAVGIM